MLCEVYDTVSLAVKYLLTIIEVSNMRRSSGKVNKLRYIYTIRGTSRDIAIKERKINNIKIKIIPFIIFFVETISYHTDMYIE